MTLTVREFTSADAPLWDAYVDGSPASSLYHLQSCRRVIEQTFGHRTVYLAATSAVGEVVGILPLVELSSRLFGRMLVSLPFFNYGGICADTDDAREALLQTAIAVAKDIRADFLEIRGESEWKERLPVKTSKVSMRLDLPEDSSTLWKTLGSKLRSQVQRPRKEGMTAAVGRDEALDAFYSVFSANMRDLGTPVYPKAFFQNMLHAFPDQTWIATVYKDGLAVASGFLTGFRDRVEIPWASSLRSYKQFSPNMLLYWTCLEFACNRGFRCFDFGRSTRDEGTFRFKQQWGARPHQLYWYYWLRRGERVPEVNPANPKYRAAIAAWQHLPIGMTQWLGPRIVKYIP